MRTGKKVWKVVLLIIVAVVVILLLVVCLNHKLRLNRESELRVPLGQMVEVDGHNMSVYVEGEGEKTLVFLSGGGTSSPILDFKSLYSLLSSRYKVVVVEKFGYGFSDIVDKSRELDSILADTRAALAAAGVEGPYILCPHSMSGLEALYWAQTCPEEVSAIIGLDMAVPQYYETMDINIPLMRVASLAADIGVTRLIPGVAESDAIQYGTLTEAEKKQYRAIFYSRTATVTMINEMAAVKENASLVAGKGVPQVPMLLFLSNGSGGTGFEEETWRRIPKEYLSFVENGAYMELDCPHYVHDHEYMAISEQMISFLSDL